MGLSSTMANLDACCNVFEHGTLYDAASELIILYFYLKSLNTYLIV